MRFKERKSRLEKARSKFEKNSRHKKQLQFHFVREKNKHGNFKTKIYLKRGVREQYSGKGILHKAVNSRFRIKGERPSFTRVINSAEMQTTGGKFVQTSAKVTNFIAHDVGQTAIDTGLAAETAAIKTTGTVSREVRYHYQNKYVREAADDYHKGLFFIGRTAVDGVKGLHTHFRSKRQHKFEKAKYRLYKAEYKDFIKTRFKPNKKKHKADFQKKKSDFKAEKQKYRSSIKSKTDKEIFKGKKQEFRQKKLEICFEKKKIKTEKKFRKKKTANQRKIKNNAKTGGFLVFKPVKYTAKRMRASAWQKAVNEDDENDFLHAVDSAKRRIAEPTVRHFSAPEKLHREQKKRDKLSDKDSRSKSRLAREEIKLKEKGQNQGKKKKRKKPKKTAAEKLKQGIKEIFKFVVNVYVKEVGKFFGTIAVPILLILLIVLFLVSIFMGTSSGGGFTLGTYAAQDYDLSEAEKYYTSLAYNMNQNILKVGTDDWKSGLNQLGIDTSNMKDKPTDFIFGSSGVFPYEPIYDFDCTKLWSFLCAYYYDFTAENGDIKYWSYTTGTEDLLKEIFNAEYEFECHYDNTSKWEQRWAYEYYAYYSFDGTGLDGNGYFIEISHPDAMPYEVQNFASENRLYYNYNNGEILNFNDNFSATGWYFQNQYHDISDPAGNVYGGWFRNGETCNYGLLDGNGNVATPFYHVIPSESWIAFLKEYDWVTDCRLYYNVKQKKTFDEVVIEKLSSMANADERVEYYNLLAGNDTATLHGNHQTLHNLLPGATIRDYNLMREFGYEMTGWNNASDGLYQGIKVYCNSGESLFAPFDCEIKDVDTDNKKITLRKDDVEYWYDGTGGTKRDTEVEITNCELTNGYEKGNKINLGDEFAKTTSGNVNFHINIDTDGFGWDYIDPRLVLY